MFELQKLADDATQEDVVVKVLKDGKDRGELHFDVEFYPVMTPTVNESGVEEMPESSACSTFFFSFYIFVLSTR
jgi:Ca2+-dependent lipid-binding protein